MPICHTSDPSTFDECIILVAKVEQPQNQLKDHLASCLVKYNQLETALGLFFLLYFCLAQVLVFYGSLKLSHQVTMVLSLYLSLTGVLRDHEKMVCDLVF